jgi:hypothetical protein
VGTAVGFYDGFFGPGTGTFFAIGYVALLGFNLRRATAHAKLLNFTSNLAALLLFTPAARWSGAWAWRWPAGSSSAAGSAPSWCCATARGWCARRWWRRRWRSRYICSGTPRSTPPRRHHSTLPARPALLAACARRL